MAVNNYISYHKPGSRDCICVVTSSKVIPYMAASNDSYLQFFFPVHWKFPKLFVEMCVAHSFPLGNDTTSLKPAYVLAPLPIVN